MGGGNIDLDDVTVLGPVTLKNMSGNVTVGAPTITGPLQVESSGDIKVYGSVASILSTKSGWVMLFNGARVFPDGVTMVLSGSLEICGTEIGINSETGTDGSGGANVIESGGVSAVAGPGCYASQIEGAVIVEKGTGNVEFLDASL